MVQVKSSDEDYAEASQGPDGQSGWWYYESDTAHFDHWVRYGLPYLLVLHDVGSATSYWVHVTGDAIDSTGKGRKIFVPKAQKLDESSRDALLQVAVQPRANVLEGSAWDGHLTKVAESRPPTHRTYCPAAGGTPSESRSCSSTIRGSRGYGATRSTPRLS